MSVKENDVAIIIGQLSEIRNEGKLTNRWMDSFANASMWSQIFQIAGLVLLALILWRVW